MGETRAGTGAGMGKSVGGAGFRAGLRRRAAVGRVWRRARSATRAAESGGGRGARAR
ncbi:hypothetical protein APASM_2519 [Actinosynnema pretiosum subsp. pretiosum]|nr:hypothetical protein APASM_2519 [Actinosynnema pretiosum subsp. pretiosum]